MHVPLVLKRILFAMLLLNFVVQPAFSQRRNQNEKSISRNRSRTIKADVTLTIDSKKVVRDVPPGVVGWGAMWKRTILWPSPPPKFSGNKGHQAYIRQLGKANLPLVRKADLRHISWPWGVSFSTFGVNWENSARPWTERPPDCTRSSGWCEKTIVGIGDLLTLAAIWDLEAVTVAVPLAVFDGNKKRWGPRLFHDDFTDPTIEKISDHAARLIAFMKKHPAWNDLDRVYLSAGCEWRRYQLRSPSSAVLTYAKLVKRIREKIKDKKVWIVASASDGADIPGRPQIQSGNWNPFLYDQLHNIPGVVLDLHRYRGMIGVQASPDGKTPLTSHNIDLLLRTGVSQRGFLTVNPRQWNRQGPSMPTVLLENAIHGHDADHSKETTTPRPWATVIAHADLVRESLSGESLAFLGWTWFPENLPPEWPHGAIRNGKLTPVAKAQGFLTEYHRDQVLDCGRPSTALVRGLASRTTSGEVRAYGGNFSQTTQTLGVLMDRKKTTGGEVEILSEKGIRKIKWDGKKPIELKQMTLWRIRFESR